MKRPWLALVLVCRAWSSPPEVAQLFPAGGQRGTVVNLSATANFPVWPVRVWTDDPAIAFEPGQAPGQFRVSLSAGARLGPHLVRFYETAGASAPGLFVVGSDPEFVELGSEERRGAGESVSSLPMTANGRLGSAGESGAYLVAVEAGQLLHAELTATGLDSPQTARLRLLDPDGQTLAETTNAPPHDPVLEARIRLTGLHRLLVELPRAETSTVSTAAAPNQTGLYRLALRARAAQRPTDIPGSVLYQSPELPGMPASVTVYAAAEWAMPSQPDTMPLTIQLPASFTGFISPIGDEDRFTFQAHADEIHRFLLRAASLGSPLTPVLRVLDESRRVLTDATGDLDTDLSLDWLAPWDGNFTVSVGDARGGGGPDHHYQLEIFAPEPYLAAEVAGHTWRLRPGEQVTVTLKLRRPATHRRVLTATTSALPPGVTATTGLVTPDGDTAKIRLDVGPDAAPANQPFQITLLDVSAIPPRFFTARAPLRGRHAPPGALLLNDTDTLWLTVLPSDR